MTGMLFAPRGKFRRACAAAIRVQGSHCSRSCAPSGAASEARIRRARQLIALMLRTREHRHAASRGAANIPEIAGEWRHRDSLNAAIFCIFLLRSSRDSASEFARRVQA
jgi:hypothetical protein